MRNCTRLQSIRGSRTAPFWRLWQRLLPSRQRDDPRLPIPASLQDKMRLKNLLRWQITRDTALSRGRWPPGSRSGEMTSAVWHSITVTSRCRGWPNGWWGFLLRLHGVNRALRLRKLKPLSTVMRLGFSRWPIKANWLSPSMWQVFGTSLILNISLRFVIDSIVSFIVPQSEVCHFFTGIQASQFIQPQRNRLKRMCLENGLPCFD